MAATSGRRRCDLPSPDCPAVKVERWSGDDADLADPGRSERDADGMFYNLVGAVRRFSMNTLVTVACGGMVA